MSGIDAGPRMLGYPVVALLFFLAAAIGGLALVVSILVTDRRTRGRAKKAEREPKQADVTRG
jgi:ubiquinone biosynthesis protein